MISHKHLFIIFTLFLSACAGLPSFNTAEDPINIPLGPQITATQQQTQVFESIFDNIQKHYIHYETDQIKWDSLRETYLTEINQGLTTVEFNTLMSQFESEFGTQEIIYISREERIAVESSVQTAEFVGIGAFINYQAEDVPHVIILDVMPESPAEKAGLRAHDSIYAVDGEPVSAEEGADVVLRIRGETGTPVVLSVQSPGEEKRDVEIIRAPVNGIGQLKVDQFQDNKIGYILLPPSASEEMINELALVLSDFSESGAQGLILDLRISNGESNWPLENMIAVFLNGTLGDVYNRTESETISLEGQDYFGSQTIPLVVLVGEQTYGAPEIFAEFVQSSGRGTVMGSNTQGNVEGTFAYLLQNGGQILIASTSIRTNDNENLGLSGLHPAVEIPAQWDEIISNQDPVIEQAIQSFEVEVQE